MDLGPPSREEEEQAEGNTKAGRVSIHFLIDSTVECKHDGLTGRGEIPCRNDGFA